MEITTMQPKRYDEISDKVNEDYLIIDISEKEDQGKKAYVSPSPRQNLIIYKYVSPEFKSFERYVEHHENGHVYFGHLINFKKVQEILEEAYIKHSKKIEDIISKDAYKGISGISKKPAAVRGLIHSMLNISMDLEINSKIFEEDEMDHLEQEMRKSLQQEDLKLCRPEYYKDKDGNLFPHKKGFMEYFFMLLDNPENLKNEQNQNGNSSASGSQDGEDGNGNGGLTESDIENIIEKYVKDTHTDEDTSDKSETIANGSSGKSNDGEDGENGKGDNDGNSEGRGLDKGGKRDLSYEYVKFDSLKKVLEKNLLKKDKKFERQDAMYYYNRKVFNTNILVSKERFEYRKRTGKFIILADCSGSIQNSNILSITSLVKNIASKYKKSRIIWWDTGCQGDYLLEKDKGPQECGGTFISRGIDYAKQYLEADDTLIVISDYEDDLVGWNYSLQKINCKKIGICWDSRINKDYLNTLKNIKTFILK
jgi:hypothetical protein